MSEPTVLSKAYFAQDLCEPDVFEAVFDAYAGKLYRYIYLHTRSKEDAEDALSATFSRLWEYVNKVQNTKVRIENVSALLYRIARNLIVDQYRRSKPAASVEEMLERGLEIPELKALSASLQAETALVLGAMNELSTDERDLLVLRFVEEAAVVDIAALYEITENNASVRIHRALNKLKDIVNR